MARSENQKLKALYVAKFILENSDENHDFTATDIKNYLEDEHDIIADRRSIYRDIDALREVFGMDIESTQGGKYKLLSRQFEFDDLRLLAECVYSAKFISEPKAKELISTIGSFGSAYQADELQSEVFLCDRVKTTRTDIIRIVSTINSAMAKQWDGEAHTPQKITFKYLKRTLDNIDNPTERRSGATYKVSPYKLIINEGNYYLLAFDDFKKEIRTYRLDRMKSVNLCDEPREGEKEYSDLNIETYTKRVFNMYGGEKKNINIRFINSLLDIVIERFGTDRTVRYSKVDDHHFIVSTDIEISDQFFGWLCGFGTKAQIIYPEALKNEYKAYLNKIIKKYE